MKKQLYILVGVIILAGCIPSVPAPLPTPTAPAANAPSQDWTFTVTFNGTTHKAEGTYIYPHWDVSTSPAYHFNLEQLSLADNIAYAPSTQLLTLSMLDKSESTYISGEHINISMSINNLSLGVNNVQINWMNGSTSQSILDELPFIYPGAGSMTPAHLYGFQNTQGTLSLLYTDPQPSYSTSSFPINITDLGTQKEIDNSNIYNNPIPGNTIKGNYSGTVYSCDTMYITITPAGGLLYNYEFNTPTQISIDFEAIREY